MKVKLIMLNGAASSTEIDVHPPVIVGRGRKAGIALPHTLVSRQHCEIYEVDGQLMIRERVSRQDVAKMIGASREMVSRVMKDLEDRGFIEVAEDGSTIIKERLNTLG